MWFHVSALQVLTKIKTFSFSFSGYIVYDHDDYEEHHTKSPLKVLLPKIEDDRYIGCQQKLLRLIKEIYTIYSCLHKIAVA